MFRRSELASGQIEASAGRTEIWHGVAFKFANCRLAAATLPALCKKMHNSDYAAMCP